jgi:thiol-disulfide isomerase/thioredoxin
MRATAIRHLRLLLIALLIVTGNAQAAASRLALAPGDSAPLLRGNLGNGKFLQVDFTANELTLVNFWASWCEPCKDEMPELQRLWQLHKGAGFEVIGVFHDAASVEVMQSFAEDLGVTYLLIRPRKGTVELWGGAGVLPLSYLVDGQGRILRRYVGATPEQVEGLFFDVGEVLEGRPMGPLVIPEEPAVAESQSARKAAGK